MAKNVGGHDEHEEQHCAGAEEYVKEVVSEGSSELLEELMSKFPDKCDWDRQKYDPSQPSQRSLLRLHGIHLLGSSIHHAVRE